MTRGELFEFGGILVLLVTFWGLIFVQLPALARVRFRHDAARLRDQCIDAVIEGRLPDGDCVEAFVERCDGLIDTARYVTLLHSLVIHRVLARAGIELKRPSFADLQPDERKLMHDLELELVRAVRRFLLNGSLLGWVVRPYIAAHKRFRTRRPNNRATARQLVQESSELAIALPKAAHGSARGMMARLNDKDLHVMA